MFSKVMSNTLFGIEARDVVVEVDVSKGIRAFSIVGMPDTAIRESVKRVTSALVNSGFQFPRKKITVNLAPAGIKKQGAFFDLPIALGILAADDEGAFSDRIERDVIAGIRHLTHVADHQPIALEDVLALELIEFRAPVNPRGKRLVQRTRSSTRGIHRVGQIDASDRIA